MIINEQKLQFTKIVHPPRNNEIKKFNSKGYFYQVEPYDDEYLKKKHQIYQKYHDSQNKQNFVYNLSKKRMPIGYYEMKGCNINEKNDNKKRRALRIIDNEHKPAKLIEESKVDSQKSQKIASSLFKRYLKRKQRLRAKSERSLTSVFADIKSNRQSIRSSSQQTQHMSYKSSERDSRILEECHKKIKLKKILSTYLTSNTDQQQIVAVYKQKIRSRRPRLKTIE